jgi:hypothetical protein
LQPNLSVIAGISRFAYEYVGLHMYCKATSYTNILYLAPVRTVFNVVRRLSEICCSSEAKKR